MRNPRTATKSSPHSPQLEKARALQRRPDAAKIIIKTNKPKKKRLSETEKGKSLRHPFFQMLPHQDTLLRRGDGTEKGRDRAEGVFSGQGQRPICFHYLDETLNPESPSPPGTAACDELWGRKGPMGDRSAREQWAPTARVKA